MTTLGLNSQKWFQLELVIYEKKLSYDKLIKSRHTLESFVKWVDGSRKYPDPHHRGNFT